MKTSIENSWNLFDVAADRESWLVSSQNWIEMRLRLGEKK